MLVGARLIKGLKPFPNSEVFMSAPQPLSRREFLHYLWLASLASVTAGTGGAVLWYATPRLSPKELEGGIRIDLAEIPEPDAGPKHFANGQFWLINIGPKNVADLRHPEGFTTRPGLIAAHPLCTHMHCNYKWVPTNDRFECPCHGAKFLPDGTRIGGPARRNLDQFAIHAILPEQNPFIETYRRTSEDEATLGQPLVLPPETTQIVVDTKKVIRGRFNNVPGVA